MNKILLKFIERYPEYKIIIRYKNNTYSFEIRRGEETIYLAYDSNYEELINSSVEHFVYYSIKSLTPFDVTNL